MAKHTSVQPGVVVSVVGPTASGKTELAIALAQKLGTEIVSADARQVYRGMAIGTAQPTAEERSAARHHLVDFLEPSALYSAGSFEEDAVPLLSRLCSDRGSAILAGGSGMYVKAALQGLDALPADLSLSSLNQDDQAADLSLDEYFRYFVLRHQGKLSETSEGKTDADTDSLRFPLVLFFHGAGERGNDNEKQLVKTQLMTIWEISKSRS